VSGTSGGSGVAGSPFIAFALSRSTFARSFSMRARSRASATVPLSSFTRTRNPSSVVSAAAVLRVGVAPNARDAVQSKRNEIARSAKETRIGPGAVRSHVLEREAHMADTAFMGAGWPQREIERDPQGEHDGARGLSLRGAEGEERGARKRLERAERSPDLARDRFVEREVEREPL